MTRRLMIIRSSGSIGRVVQKVGTATSTVGCVHLVNGLVVVKS